MKISLFFVAYVKTYAYLYTCNHLKLITMTTLQKKKAIKKLATNMLKESNKLMLQKIDKALNSGAIDVDAWEENSSPMITPKIIVTAILVNESKQYEGKGTCFEKLIKKEVNDLQYFL